MRRYKQTGISIYAPRSGNVSKRHRDMALTPAFLADNFSFQTPQHFKPEDKNQDFRPMILICHSLILTPTTFMTLPVKHRALHPCFNYTGNILRGQKILLACNCRLMYAKGLSSSRIPFGICVIVWINCCVKLLYSSFRVIEKNLLTVL